MQSQTAFYSVYISLLADHNLWGKISGKYIENLKQACGDI